jgi:hypothetical protein
MADLMQNILSGFKDALQTTPLPLLYFR